MARWTAGAKWAAGPAPDGQRDMPLSLRLSEGLGVSAWAPHMRLVLVPVPEALSGLSERFERRPPSSTREFEEELARAHRTLRAVEVQEG